MIARVRSAKLHVIGPQLGVHQLTIAGTDRLVQGMSIFQDLVLAGNVT